MNQGRRTPSGSRGREPARRSTAPSRRAAVDHAHRGHRPPGHSRQSRRRAVHSARLGLFGLFIGVAVVLLVLRLVLVQVFDGASYARYATSEVEQPVTLPATRGAIYDRNGNLLAASTATSNVIADDIQISRPLREAAKIATVLHLPLTGLVKELSEKKNGYVVLDTNVTSKLVAQLGGLGLPGITFAGDSERVAPDASLFEPLLGGLSAADQGVTGIEEEYNSLLAGKGGSEVIPEAPGGTALSAAPSKVVPARDGEGLALTIDEPLQVEVTKDVTDEMVSQHADSGVAVVEDVHTGAILAMVDLTLNAKGKIVDAEQNLAVTSIYEPGSVMKIATFSYALKDGVVTPQTVITVPFSLSIGGYTFTDADYHPTQPMAACEILEQSSNIGTIEIAHDLGMDRLYQAFRALGFGRPTGLGWPGASRGLLGTPSSWTGSDQGSVPIGLGEAVTPLQILDAYSAIANGGVAETPHLASATIGANGTEKTIPEPKGHRVLPSWVAKEMVPMFEGVVQDGTAVDASIQGYTVAGKTGTAEVPNPKTGGYISGDYNSTFVGFVPAQAPQLSAIVTLQRASGIYGGSVAAPVFSKIMSYALQHFDIAPPANAAAPACTGVGATAPTPS